MIKTPIIFWFKYEDLQGISLTWSAHSLDISTFQCINNQDVIPKHVLSWIYSMWKDEQTNLTKALPI